MHRFRVQLWPEHGGKMLEVIIEACDREHARKIAQAQYSGYRVGLMFDA